MSLKVYRGRTLARSQALQLLFQAEATDSPLECVLEGDFLISKGPLDPYALELCRGAYEHIDRIDCALRSVAKNWDLMRMPGADRNLLRIAVYEMRFLTDEEVSDAIVINEAVELAKAYGTDQSASFVNGVLGKIARSEELPGEDLYQELLAEDRAREEAQAAEAAAKVAAAPGWRPAFSDEDADGRRGRDRYRQGVAMPEGSVRNFDEISNRLDQIIATVRSKDTSLERSLDLFDEAIELGSRAVDMVDKFELTPREADKLEQEYDEDAANESQDSQAASPDTNG